MKKISELPTHMKLVKVDVMVWNSLKSLKSESDTFNDVIKTLLGQRTKMLGNDNLSATKYSRKISFVETEYNSIQIGIEFEYNDIKSQKDNFILDLKFKKIFYQNNKLANPSEFFGVDYAHKHFNKNYLQLYLECISFILGKEFRITIPNFIYHDLIHSKNGDKIIEMKNYDNLIKWRKAYFDYGLSQESFVSDIEDPLKLSTEEKISLEYKKMIESSISAKLFKHDSFERDIGMD